MEYQPTSLPSVDLFLNASGRAIQALKAIVKRDIKDVFPLSFADDSLHGEEVIGRIEQLQHQAKRLKLLEGILPLFTRRPKAAAVESGLMSAAARNGMFTAEAYLKLIEGEFSNWVSGEGQLATELRCDRGFALYHLGHEFRSFQATAPTLGNAADAGKSLLKAPSDVPLRLRVKTGIRTVLDLHQKEFTDITRHGADGTSEPFILKKIASYDTYRLELERLASVWLMGPDDIGALKDETKPIPQVFPNAIDQDASRIESTPLTSNGQLETARIEILKILEDFKPASNLTAPEKFEFETVRKSICCEANKSTSADLLTTLASKLHTITRTPEQLKGIEERLHSANQNNRQ